MSTFPFPIIPFALLSSFSWCRTKTNIYVSSSRRSDGFFIDDRSLGDIGNYDFVNGPEAAMALSTKLGGGCNATLPISPDHIRQVILRFFQNQQNFVSKRDIYGCRGKNKYLFYYNLWIVEFFWKGTGLINIY